MSQQFILNSNNTVSTLLDLASNPQQYDVEDIFKQISEAPYEPNGVRSAALQAFLRLLYNPFLNKNGSSELYIQASYKDGQYMKAQYYRLSNLQFGSMANYLIQKNKMYSCAYFGVNPRVEVASKENGYEIQATSSLVEQSSAIWIDVDAKAIDPTDISGSKKLILSIVKEKSPVAPSIVTDTGNGYHLYYLLDKAYDDKLVVDVCRRLESHIEIADSVHNADRIMRTPWTINWKNKKHPVQARINTFTDRRYTLDEFQSLPEAKSDKIGYRSTISKETTVKDITVKELQMLIHKDKNLLDKIQSPMIEYVQKYSQKKVDDRSNRDFHIVCQLIKEGFTDAQILSVFNTFSQGVGEKYHERLDQSGLASANRYVAHTIEKARSSVEEEQRNALNSVVIIDNRFS